MQAPSDLPCVDAPKLASDLKEILRVKGLRSGQPWQLVEKVLISLIAVTLDVANQPLRVQSDAFPISEVATLLRRTTNEVCAAILATPNDARRALPLEPSGSTSEDPHRMARLNDELMSAARLAGLSESDLPDFYTEFVVASDALSRHTLFSDGEVPPGTAAAPALKNRRAVRASSQQAMARLDRAVELRSAGATLGEIGAELGVTRERVRQILSQSEAPGAAEVRAMRSVVRDSALQEIRDGYVDFLEGRAPMTVSEAAKALGVERGVFVERMDERLRWMVVPDPKRGASKWSRENIAAVLQAAATFEYPLTTKGYAELRRSRMIEGPSVPRITQVFGTWSGACHAAGVETGKRFRPSYSSKWTDDDLVDAVRRYFTETKARTAAGYSVWAEQQDDRPSGATVRNRLGRWSDIIRRVHETTYSEGAESGD